tara:strand:+ start:1083 stop:1259 length:177 start_codon:yes stop_codon:yes gene_type:complete
MKKFEGWRTEELQFLASLMAGRAMEVEETALHLHLYPELIREIRNRRIKEELFQMKLE